MKDVTADTINQRRVVGPSLLTAFALFISGCGAGGQPIRTFSAPPGASISQINMKNYELNVPRSATPGEAVVIIKNYTLSWNKSSTLIPEDGWRCNVPEGSYTYSYASIFQQSVGQQPFFLPTDDVVSIEVKNEFERDGKTWLTGDVSTASGKANMPSWWLFPVDKQTLTANCLSAAVRASGSLTLPYSGTFMHDCGRLPRCKFKWLETASVVTSPDEKNFELVFAGEESKGELSFVYRQYVHGNRAPVFEHKFDQPASDPFIKYKNVVIEIKRWNGQLLEYKVISD